ncbi:MAG: glycosyltransferase [Lachnotalea sp.]
MKKLISIIIPCYNVENYIIRCIESLINQTMHMDELELIFINDASTDCTLDILIQYEKSYSSNIIAI